MTKRSFLILKTGLILTILFLVILGIGVSKIEAKNLNVPRFSQTDRRWGGEKLGFSRLSIRNYGCALISKAMIFNYYRSGFTNPSKLNRYLKSHGGYWGKCSMRWNNTGTPSGVSYQGTLRLNRNVIKQKINQGYPLLTQVWTSRHTMHFVVITGVSGSKYLINDSWDGKKTFLRARRYTLANIRFYKGSSYSKPKTKSPPALRITKGLWLKNYHKAYAGEPFDAQYTVKNFSKKTVRVKNLSLWVRGPRGQNLDLGGSGRLTLRPGKSYRLFKKTNSLGRYGLTGTYRFGCSYQDTKGRWHNLSIGRKGAVSRRNLRVINPSYKATYLKNHSFIPTEVFGNELTSVTLKFKNTGSASWHQGGRSLVRLGTWNKRDHNSPFYDKNSWTSRGRVKLKQKVVRPGHWGSFVFDLKVGEVQKSITKKESFRLVCERRKWFDSRSQVNLSFRVNPSYKYQIEKINPSDFELRSGQVQAVNVLLKNTGNKSWQRDGVSNIMLGTVDPENRESEFLNNTWENAKRIKMEEEIVRPGETGSFQFEFQGPAQAPGDFQEKFKLILGNQAWIKNGGIVQFQISLTGSDFFEDQFESNNQIETQDQVKIENGKIGLDTWQDIFSTQTKADFNQGDYSDLIYDESLGGVRVQDPKITILQIYPQGYSQTFLQQIINQYAPDPAIFEITTVSINNFNNNRSNSGQPLNLNQFDLLYFGIADVYGSNPPNRVNDLSAIGENLVREFHSQGKGVIFTHDVLGAGSPCWLRHNRFNNLSDITGITTDARLGHWKSFRDVMLNPEIDSTHSMLNYPYQIPSNFAVLTTHRLYQKVIAGDIFAYFQDPENLYWQSFNNSTFFSYGNFTSERMPAEWEGKALINTLYNTYQGGIYTSEVHDMQSDKGAVKINWDLELPSALTEGVIEIRFGDTQIPDQNWSSWIAVENEQSINKTGRFIQYRARLKSYNLSQSSLLKSVDITTDPLYYPEGILTSVSIHPANIKEWLSFNPDYDLNNQTIQFDLLNGNDNSILIANMQNDIDLSGVNPNLPLKLRARFSTDNGLQSPELDVWRLFYWKGWE